MKMMCRSAVLAVLAAAAAPALAQLMKASGLRDVTVDYRSPVPGADALSPAAAADPAFAPIARLLFAPQDYAVSGVK